MATVKSSVAHLEAAIIELQQIVVGRRDGCEVYGEHTDSLRKAFHDLLRVRDQTVMAWGLHEQADEE